MKQHNPLFYFNTKILKWSIDGEQCRNIVKSYRYYWRGTHPFEITRTINRDPNNMKLNIIEKLQKK